MGSTVESAPLPADIAEELSGYRRTFVDVGGQRMHVMMAGRGPEMVVMFHGNPTWGYLYRKVVAALDLDRFTVVLPDLIGLGLSDKPAELAYHTLDNHIAWMRAGLEALELGSVIAVVQDWGGPIGLAALGAAPRITVRGLVVLNTVIGPPKPGFRPTLFHRLARVPLLSDVSFRGLGLVERLIPLAQGDRRSVSRQAARAYRFPLRGWRAGVAPLALARMVPDTLDHPSMAGLRRCSEFINAFDGPSAIVWGDRDPVLGRVRTHVERTLPDAVVTRTNGGHFLPDEKPGPIAAAVTDVANRCSA